MRGDVGAPGLSYAPGRAGSWQRVRGNVIDARNGILELRFGEHALVEPAQDSEQLELVIAA